MQEAAKVTIGIRTNPLQVLVRELMVKRGAPLPTDTTLIRAGESISQEILVAPGPTST